MTSSFPLSSRNRLYAGVAAFGAAGGAWLACTSVAGAGITVCPFKLATGVACPACGSTRAVLALFEGGNPLQYNPLGLTTAAVAGVALVLMARDVATGSDVLLRAWRRGESMLRRPPIAATVFALLVTNWIWNISKGL